MDDKNIDDLFRHLDEINEENTSRLIYALELVKTTLVEAISTVRREIQEASTPAEVRQLTTYWDNINDLIKSLESHLSFLAGLNTDESTVLPKIPENEDVKQILHPYEMDTSTSYIPKEAVDYSEYIVDRAEPHALTEHFKYKRICGFRFSGKEYAVRSWKEALLRVCSMLQKEDPRLFAMMTEDPDFKGKRVDVFSHHLVKDKRGRARNQKLGNTDFYVLTNSSAETIARQIKMLLDHFGYDPSKFIVFLRADYTTLHQ